MSDDRSRDRYYKYVGQKTFDNEIVRTQRKFDRMLERFALLQKRVNDLQHRLDAAVVVESAEEIIRRIG